MISDAVSLELLSRVVGYKIIKGDFAETTPNLPMRVVVLAEANTANQATLNTEPKQYNSAQKVGAAYGYGSPAYMVARILTPKFSQGLGGIPVIYIPQEEADGATEKILTLTPTGVATGNGTHYVVIAGRNGMDGEYYSFTVNTGDTTADITTKIADTVNKVLGCPMTVADTDYETTFTSKWKGKTADELSVRVDTGENDLGITYTVSEVQAGAGTPDIADALETFGSSWNTIVVNSYGFEETIIAALEAFNGIPDPENPTGRFVGIVMKPFVAITGSTEEDPSSLTDTSTRKINVTIATASAPLSEGLSMEAAANVTVLEAVNAQNSPHTDINGQSYPDMPIPADENIGEMSDYMNRDAIAKKGCSTVSLSGGRYIIEDFITTYHPEGETPPQFKYVRNLFIDFNIRFGYYLLEQKYVVDHVIADDADTVTADKVVKPKIWKSVLFDYADKLSKRGLIVQPSFMTDSLQVGLGTSNPDRLETFFRYKRSGVVRVASTTAEAGFNFGVLN